MLGCSYLELDARPDKGRLMTLAFTFQSGENEGEYIRETNPQWAKKKKAFSDAMNKANG